MMIRKLPLLIALFAALAALLVFPTTVEPGTDAPVPAEAVQPW